jgi:choline dehydrogenase-like flavoprotein
MTMFIDGRELADDTLLEYDLCIVGAGAAGITIALELANRPYRICLLESGGLEYEQPTQDLYRGSNRGLPYYLSQSRLRFLGGSTNHWQGNCSPLQPIDFEALPWVPGSGWPLSRRDLDPYYRRAQSLCGLGQFDYQAEHYWGARAYSGLPDPSQRFFDCQVLQIGPPVRFGSAYRAELERAENLDLYHHLNLLRIDLDAGGRRVEGLQLGTLNGGRLAARAKHYVVACGGIENARLMLASDTMAKAGVGNDHDQVGRCFMEHPRLPAGQVTVSERVSLPPVFSPRRIAGVLVRGFLQLSPEQQRARQLTACAIELGKSARSPDTWQSRLERMQRALQSPETAAGEAFGEQGVGTGGGFRIWDVQVTPGQSPNPSSRVTLGTERDALGMRRAVLDWRLNELDRLSVVESVRALGQALGQTGSGRAQLAEWLRGDGFELPGGHFVGNHHMGTTRMSAAARDGVVDSDCRVHGVDNLFVAGSSVFPSCGCANPTLTIVALAVRLAAHLSALSGPLAIRAKAGPIA